MPAEALAQPHLVATATASPGSSGFSLTFGSYAEASFVGMTVKVSLSQPLVNLQTGDVNEVSWTATVGPDGTATIVGLPFNDDPALWPTGTSYYAEWQALSWKPSPGNKAFAVKQSAGPTVDFDLIGAPAPLPTTYAQVGSAVVGISIVD